MLGSSGADDVVSGAVSGFMSITSLVEKSKQEISDLKSLNSEMKRRIDRNAKLKMKMDKEKESNELEQWRRSPLDEPLYIYIRVDHLRRK